MKVLLVIDMQKDFVDPDGALYFPGADALIQPIAQLIGDYHKNNLPVITTQDWHDPDDLEFQRFPVHCVKDTAGAELTQEVKETLKQNHHRILKTRYSAFYNTNLDEIIAKLKPELVEVVGVVTNICVLHTVEELRNRDIPVRVHSKLVDSFDKKHHSFALEHMAGVLGAEVV